MRISCKWLIKSVVTIPHHLKKKKPAWAADNVFCIPFFAVHELAREVTIVFEPLQGLTTQFPWQRLKLSALIDTYCQIKGRVRLLAEAHLDEFESISAKVFGALAITHNNTPLCTKEIFVLESISE